MDRCIKCPTLLSASLDSGTMCNNCMKKKQTAFINECNAPAFPIGAVVHPNGQIEYGKDGLTKREWFAGEALKGLLSTGQRVEGLTKSCYEIADAMIRQGME